MTYSFDAIKNNLHLGILSLSAPLVFIALLLISHTNSLAIYLPHFFIRSFMIPIIILIAMIVLIVWNKKKLFWTRIVIEINAESLIINSKQFDFNELEYFEYRPGPILTTGGRSVLIIKFKEAKKVRIIPCRSTPYIENYDRFKTDFDQIIETLNLQKKKKSLSKAGRIVLISICALIPVVFIFYG